MSKIISITQAQSEALLNARARELDDGAIKIYSGTVPADADSPLSGATMLVECALNATSAPAAVNRQLTFNAINSGTNAASGNVSFWRAEKSDGTVIMQGTAGASGSANSLILDNVVLVVGGQTNISALVVQGPS